MRKIGIITLSIASAIIVGCDMGGSSSSNYNNYNESTIKKGALTPINTQNQDKIVASALSVYKIDDPINSIDVGFRLTNEADSKIYANRVLKLTVSKRVGSYECESGKTKINDHSNGVNKDIDLIFENCKINNVIIDGLIHYNTFNNKDNFDATVTNLTIKVEDNNQEIYYESALVKSTETTLNEELTGYIKDKNNTVTFKELKIDVKELSSKKIYKVDGSLSTSCLGNGWIDINTTKDIEKNITNECPTVGTVEISGNSNKIKAVYKDDESVEIYLDNNLTKTYSSCIEMEEDLKGKCN